MSEVEPLTVDIMDIRRLLAALNSTVGAFPESEAIGVRGRIAEELLPLAPELLDAYAGLLADYNAVSRNHCEIELLLHKENERLRGALEIAAKEKGFDSNTHADFIPEIVSLRVRDWIHQAREALEACPERSRREGE